MLQNKNRSGTVSSVKEKGCSFPPNHIAVLYADLPHLLTRHFFPRFPSQGDRSRGRDECVAGAEGGLPSDCRVPVGPAAALPSDPQHHRRREELHHHFPAAAGDDARVHQTLRRGLTTCRSQVHTHTHF